MEKSIVQMFEGEDMQWYFQLRSGTGEVIYVSNGFPSEQMCLDGIDDVRMNAPYDLV